MSSGRRYVIIGPTRPTLATPFVSPKPPRRPFGAHPVWMNRAVMMPHAMKAARFGMIIPLRKVPKRWTPTRAPPPDFVAVGVDVVVMMSLHFLWLVNGY